MLCNTTKLKYSNFICEEKNIKNVTEGTLK